MIVGKVERKTPGSGPGQSRSRLSQSRLSATPKADTAWKSCLGYQVPGGSDVNFEDELELPPTSGYRSPNAPQSHSPERTGF